MAHTIFFAAGTQAAAEAKAGEVVDGSVGELQSVQK